MAEKKVNLKILCRRGGTFNGAIEGIPALGGSNKQDGISFNYNNYIQSSFTLRDILGDLNLLEIQDLSLQLDCGDPIDLIDTSIYCQLTLNGNAEYIKLFYIKNNTTIITQLPENFLANRNYDSPINLLLTTEFQRNKIYISGMQLIIKYRELEDWEIPDVNGKIYTKPKPPTITSVCGDINDKYFEDLFRVDFDYTDQCNQINLRIINDGGALIYTNTYTTCKQITVHAKSISFTQGQTYFIQLGMTNTNGTSEWGDLSNGIIKCNKSSLDIREVYGPNVINYAPNVYYVNLKANIKASFNIGLTTITTPVYDLCEVLIQNNINGLWNDIPDTKTKVSYNGQAILEIDFNNEPDNGGIDIGEYSVIRLKSTFGNKVYYSKPVTLFRCPLSKIGLTNMVATRIRLPLAKLKINGSFTRNRYTSNCKVSCYRQIADNLELVSYIMVDTDKFTLDIAPLLNKKYSYGDILILSYSGCNINGVYSDEIFDIVTYQVSEILDTPVLTFADNYEPTTYGSYNLYYKDKVQLRWNEITPKLFPHDKITYNVYRNNELIKTTTKTAFTDYPDAQTVVYTVSVSNGYDEFKSIPKLKNRIKDDNKPKFSTSGRLLFRPVSALLTQSADSFGVYQNKLPTKTVISFNPAQSDTTPQEDLKYLLYIGHYNEGSMESQTYVSCSQLNNTTYDPIRQMNDAIIDFKDFGFNPDDKIVVCVTCVDRYGVESVNRSLQQNESGNIYVLQNGTSYIAGPYIIDQNPIYPVVFGANGYDNKAVRTSPITCGVFQGDMDTSLIRNPLLEILFTGGDDEYSFKIIQSIDNIPMETLEPDSDTIYPQGNIKLNSQELRFARFTGVSDEIDIETLKNHYWHDLIYDPQTKNLILVGNGEHNILVSTNYGLSWKPAPYSTPSTNSFCLYQIKAFQDVMVTVGEEWTPVIQGQNYYVDNDGTLKLKNDSDMIKEYDYFTATDVQSAIFTPTIHNKVGVAYIKDTNSPEAKWEKKSLPMSNCRSIIVSPDKLLLIPGDGSIAYYTENKLLDPNDWVTINLPGNNRNYTGAYGDGKYVLFSIDNHTEFYYSTDGINWTAKPINQKASWYCCEYVEKYVYSEDQSGEKFSSGFLIGSVNGYVGFIDSNTLEYCQLYYKEDTHWYDIKKSDNMIMIVGGCGDEKRILVCSDNKIKEWMLKKSSIGAWHNVCFCPVNKSFIVVSYDGNDGGRAFIDYFINLENEDVITSINTRLYTTKNGTHKIECYNLPDDYILPQESGFNSIKFSTKVGGIGVKEFDTGSVIYADNYYLLIKHLFEVIQSYYYGVMFNDHLPINDITPYGDVETDHRDKIPKAFIDFIGTYGNGSEKTFNDFLQICHSLLTIEFFNIITMALDKGLIDTNGMPQQLYPIYGNNIMTTHNWVPGELVFKDNQETPNKADQMMIGLKAIMDLLSKR